jgi:hypothetical protein
MLALASLCALPVNAQEEQPMAAPSAPAPAAKPVPKPAATRGTPEAPPTPSERAWIRSELKVNFRASASP